ncbi:MAG: type II toxin-antitoxin system HigB family toxin [Halieaceae bacterium]|nr:type II toxin-antitoxin system HigB family toxin [Halieaceae bacterium]
MHIITRKTLAAFWSQSQYQDAEQPLKTWLAEARHAQWRSPDDIKQKFRSASILHNNRVVFNIAGNKYRLVVKIHYNRGVVYIRFTGTHAQYDKIDAETI